MMHLATRFCTISTHDLTRRSTVRRLQESTQSIFQLTTSQGGRPRFHGDFTGKVVFQLTTSQGGRRRARKHKFFMR